MLYPTIDFLKARFRFLLVRGIARFHSLHEHPSFLRRSCSQLVASLNPTPPALSSLFSTIQVVFGRPLFLFPVHIKCNFGYPITGLLKHSIICLFVFFSLNTERSSSYVTLPWKKNSRSQQIEFLQIW